MLRKIMVPVRGDGMIDTVLGHASALARHHGAHIVVAHCRKRTEDMRPYSRALPGFARTTMIEQSQAQADQEEHEVREQLHRFAVSLDVRETDTPEPGTASVEFVEEYGQMADVIKHNGRLADLVVVARPDRDRNIGTNSLKSALYQTGRPVLMCPPKGTVAPEFGAHITLAWNGSLEASRAVAMTLDLARAAQTVTILSGGKGEPHGATAEELIAYYRLRGVTAVSHRFEARNPGEALPRLTAEMGASLLVMGAYGHNHERETLFGGNTQVVVDKSEIPVVLVH
ncbi:universal stress protein [uncultured Roseobacter sp.]|uniref:universal stress protein n=1 Tax=uncultured Roseobacter sp. TaxID=114847 RepID=UPI00261D5E9C|nr:universal stress protein [uncultured Roseobacter sp.]